MGSYTLFQIAHYKIMNLEMRPLGFIRQTFIQQMTTV